MFKVAIFDIDGTLLDSVDQHAEAWRLAFEHFDVHLPFSEIRYQIGKGGDKLLDSLLSPEEKEEKGERIERYRKDLFQKRFLNRCVPFAGVPDLFREIRDRGLKTALASSAKKDEVDLYVKMLGITGLVDQAVSSDDIEESKPAPDILQAVRKKLSGLQPEECVFIGDSPHDAEAAKRDGMKMIGVLCGGFLERDLRDAGASQLFHNPQDLLENWEVLKEEKKMRTVL